MKREQIRPIYKRGDKLDILFLSVATLLVTLLLFSNVSIPALNGIDGAKYGKTFFNLGFLSYFTELPLNIIYSASIGAAAIFVLFILIIRRRTKALISTKLKVLFLILAIGVFALTAVNVMLFIPTSRNASSKMILFGQNASQALTYTINLQQYNLIYRISFLVSYFAFILYFYFLTVYLRSFSHCASSFISFMLYTAILISVSAFLGIFFNTSTQDTIINNYKAFMSSNFEIREVTHPIISNSLINSFLFAGCLSTLVLFYRKPNLIWYILSLGFGLASFLTGNIYGFLLDLFAITITSFALLLNMRKHYISSIVAIIVTLLIGVYIGLSVTVLKNMFPAVVHIFDGYVMKAKTVFATDLYRWKVSLSAIVNYFYAFAGYTPSVSNLVNYQVTNLYNVNYAPLATSGNAYIQTIMSFGYVGIGILVLAYGFILVRCFGMLKNKKKAGLFYLLVFITILLSGIIFDYGLFTYSPLSMIFVLIFVYPLSSDYHLGLIESGNNLAPGEIKSVEHKYVNYDVQVEDIKQNGKKDSGVNKFQDAEYQEEEKEKDSFPFNPPDKDEYWEEKKKTDGQSRLKPSQEDNHEDEEVVSHRQEDTSRSQPRNYQQPTQERSRPQQTRPQADQFDYREEREPNPNKEPEMIILKELPTTLVSEEAKKEELAKKKIVESEVSQVEDKPAPTPKPTAPKVEPKPAPPAPKPVASTPNPTPRPIPKQRPRASEEGRYDNIVEKQIRLRDEPVKAHYKVKKRKINLVMTSPRIVSRPTGEVVSRRNIVVERKEASDDSYEIIPGKTDTISPDGSINAKEKPRVIMDYDKFNHLKKEELLVSSANDTTNRNLRKAVDLKPKIEKEELITDKVDTLLHSSTSQPKPKNENVSFFDDLLSMGSSHSVNVEDFKKQSMKEKEELHLKMKLKCEDGNTQDNLQISQKPEIASAVSFDDMLEEKEEPMEKIEKSTSLNTLLERKDIRDRKEKSKIKIIKEDNFESSDTVKKMFDDLLEI